jgi:threonylcarbamoyladenosine tRNA methylthiotransferase MtaB
MPTLATYTLGCKVNQYETEYLREGFRRLGYREAADGEPIDLCVVNTCTVTAEGDAKSRKMIRQLARRHPAAEIIVTGCYATRAADELAALPGVAEVVADKRALPDLLARRGLIDVHAGISRFGRRHRAYVKVQDGCRAGCAYCVIPLVRPVLSSRPVRDVLGEVRRLVEGGHREIVLVGIHLGHYRVERGESPGGKAGSPDEAPDLVRLVRALVDLPGEFRLRLSSLEAAEVTPGLLALMADRPDRLCPHLHLPLQSGSDDVLRRMRRGYTRGEFLRRCEEVLRRFDRPALTTDVIVGFPGERDEDFEATCRAVVAAGFSKLHVFRFSPREGTPAAAMPDQLPQRVVQERAHRLGNLGNRLRRQYMESLVGSGVQVLLESRVDGRFGVLLGTADRYVPVEIPAADDQIGRLVAVPTRGIRAGRLHA